MKIKLIASFSGIELEKSEQISISNVKIVHGSSIIKKLKEDRDLLIRLGTFEADQIVAGSVIYYEGELSDFPGEINKDLNIYDLARQFERACSLIFKSFWHDVDNSINVDKVLVINSETKDFSSASSYGRIFNSSCQLTNIRLPQETTINILNFYSFRSEILLKSSIGQFKQDLKAEDFKPGVPVYLTSPPVQYDHSRLFMAFAFLDISRSQVMLPLRISFNMVMYETLFCTSNLKVGQQIKSRLSIYLQASRNKTNKVNKLIKDSYDIRSRFLHGNKLEEKYNHAALLQFSKKLDNLNRELFAKILVDNEVFEMEEQKFNQYFLKQKNRKKPDHF